MATELEVLQVRLEAVTAKYNKAMEEAARKTKTSTSKIGNAIKSTVGRLTALAIVLAIARRAYQEFEKSFARIDKLAKTADKLGLTTEALGGLRHAAKLTGVAQNTLDMSLQRMTRRVAEAGQGMGEAQGALKELGLEAEEMAQLAPDEMFMKIAGAMEAVEEPADRLRLGFKLFDSEGAALVNTLALGEGGLRVMAEEAKRFGTAISRVDAQKIEDANDAITRTGEALNGLVNKTSVAFAGAIEKAASTLTVGTEMYKRAIFERQDIFTMFQEMVQEATEREMAALNAKNEARTDAEKNVQKKLTDIQLEGDAIREKFDKASNTRKVQMVAGSLRDMVSTIGTESRTMFNISKGLAYAEAVVNAHAGATRNLAAYPGPLGIAMATAAYAAGVAQIQAIAATQYQEGGGGGAEAAPAASADAAAGTAETVQDVNVVLQGQSPMAFSELQMRDFIDTMSDTIDDGTRIRSITISG